MGDPEVSPAPVPMAGRLRATVTADDAGALRSAISSQPGEARSGRPEERFWLMNGGTIGD